MSFLCDTSQNASLFLLLSQTSSNDLAEADIRLPAVVTAFLMSCLIGTMISTALRCDVSTVMSEAAIGAEVELVSVSAITSVLDALVFSVAVFLARFSISKSG